MNRNDEIALYQMYVHTGIKAIKNAPDADAVVILRTASGKEHCFPISLGSTFAPQIVSTLVASEDTHILYVVHIWKNHWLDIPAYDLRKALMDIHPENKNAKTMLIGENSFIIRSIEDTMR